MPAEMEFCLLGPLTVRHGAAAVTVPRGRLRAILAMLLLNAGQVVRADEVAETLWVSGPPPSGPVAVQNYVMRLRNTLGAPGRARIITAPPGYLIRVQAGELDLSRFEALLGAARTAARDSSWDQAATCARQALELWRGEPLTDISCEALTAREAPRLAELRLQTLELRIDADLHLGRHTQVITELWQLTGAHSLRERLHGQLMLALCRDGRQAEALAAYRHARDVLVTELGVEPGPGLRDLHQRILAGDPALAAAEPAPVASRRAPGNGTSPRLPTAAKPRPGGDAGQGPAAGMVYSLPPDTAAFSGRQGELDQITAAVTQSAASGGVVAICAIGGMPGVGKTALAVHAAHLLKDRFPDRQLFVSLHAHTPGQDPLTPHAALAGLLTAAGVDARHLPGDLAGRAALWRDQMAGQKALLVLDNAASTAQVTPLLPGSAGCLVLVTSRRHLGDLPGATAQVQLPVLTADEARKMFTRLAPRAAAGPDQAITELAGLAGFLPLAVSLLARVYARHRSWTLADLAAETRAGMLTLTAEHDSVAAAFELSYRYLAPARQQFFRRLGLHPGTSTDAYAAAALGGVSLHEAAGQLDGLHGEGLLTETGHRRYGMHDLICRYARDLAAGDPAASQQQGLDRLLDYYQHTAALADGLLARQARTRPAPALQTIPAAVPALGGRTKALAWARAERDSLLACLDQAAAAGQHARVVALTAATASLLRHDGPWTSAISRHAAAAVAACHLGDRLAQASALTDLGDVRLLTGDHRGAGQALEQALAIYHDIGDRLGQANALHDLGRMRGTTGDNRGAGQALEQALGIYRDIGDRLGQANALNNLGNARGAAGDYRGAAQALEQALDIFRDLGDQWGQGNALRTLGIVRQMTGDYRAAVQAQEKALAIYRHIGDQLGQANALNNLGDVRQMTGDYRGAAQALEQALGIYRDVGDQWGQAFALNNLGTVWRMTGDYRAAAQAQDRALAISRQTGDRGCEAEILNETGALHRARGNPGRAAEYHRQALNLSRQIASPRDQARALAGLGRCALTLGRTSDAIEGLRQARDIFQQIGAAEAADVTAELGSLTGREQQHDG